MAFLFPPIAVCTHSHGFGKQFLLALFCPPLVLLCRHCSFLCFLVRYLVEFSLPEDKPQLDCLLDDESLPVISNSGHDGHCVESKCASINLTSWSDNINVLALPVISRTGYDGRCADSMLSLPVISNTGFHRHCVNRQLCSSSNCV